LFELLQLHSEVKDTSEVQLLGWLGRPIDWPANLGVLLP
jgi:hypothetical protein